METDSLAKTRSRHRALARSGSPKAPKLTEDQVREARVMLETQTIKAVAAHFNVSRVIVSYLKSGKTYKGVE